MTIPDVRQGLHAYLLADAAISALVGGIRIYPVKLLQGQVNTSIVYSRISEVGDHHMTGPSGLNSIRIQIDAWAQTAAAANTLANLIKERIDGFSGVMTYGANSPPDQQVTVQGVFFDSAREDWDQTATLYRVSRDYFFWVEER